MSDIPACAVLAGVLESSAYGGNPPNWDEAMAALPSGALPFLDPCFVPARRAAAGLPEDRDPLLLDVAATVEQDPWLRYLAWYLYWRVFVAPERGIAWGCPSLVPRLGTRAGAFYLLLSLELVPRITEWHRRLGYPSDVTAQTIRQITDFESNHLRGCGCPGIYGHQFVWMSCYLIQPYVRLGRFEYEMHVYTGTLSVWKRRDDGAVLALAGDGTRVASDGLCLPPSAAGTEGWTATLEETAGEVRGYPVDPQGQIQQRRVRLARTEWALCFQKGDTVLDLHIPSGGAMTWEVMASSLRQAVEFFPRHHPERPVAAVVLSTWFMDPQLADLLPAEANPLRLQRAGYLYPVPPWQGGLWFVFLKDTTDLSVLPRETSLQRAVAGFLDRGGVWKGGGWFILPGDIPDFAEGRYRKGFPAVLASLDTAYAG